MTPLPIWGWACWLHSPVVVVSARRHILPAVRRHWALCAVCAVLTAFAVSNVITANGVTLATLPLPASFIKLFSVFRSGGRLFWPVYYLLTLAAFAGLARLPRGPSGSHCLPPCSCGM